MRSELVVSVILFFYHEACLVETNNNTMTTRLSSPSFISSTSVSSLNMTSSTTQGFISVHSTIHQSESRKTSFVISPSKTITKSQIATSFQQITASISSSISINMTKPANTSIRNEEVPTSESKAALYWGVGGGVGALALVSFGILTWGCFSKYKSQHRVDVSSEHTSDMPLGDCPSWRHVNVKHPLSSRITERTEHSSSY